MFTALKVLEPGPDGCVAPLVRNVKEVRVVESGEVKGEGCYLPLGTPDPRVSGRDRSQVGASARPGKGP